MGSTKIYLNYLLLTVNLEVEKGVPNKKLNFEYLIQNQFFYEIKPHLEVVIDKLS